MTSVQGMMRPIVMVIVTSVQREGDGVEVECGRRQVVRG